ncbi:MAG: sensor histidine kinase N-terminal domain-containing protein, partial [Proteobacteria bacterium]|nr:sensor histidine kinase N-terminal domain-containing protein [Pseudomonadota bacterium]
ARRLLTLLLVPLGGLFLLALLFDYLVVVGPMRTTFDRSLADAAMVFAAYVREAPGGRVTLELPAAVAHELTEAQGSRPRYALFAADGRLVSGDARLPPPPDVRAALPAGFSFATTALPSGERLRLAWYRFDSGSARYALVVAEPLGDREDATRPLVTATLTLDTLQLVAVVAFVLIGVRQGLRPLQEFRDEIARRPATGLEPLDERRVPHELQPLVAALNALLARVRAAAESQQKFVTDAAHQLRTPLAGMQAQLELLEREADALPVRDRVRSVREGLKRLAHTAHQLLTLARAEGAATLERDFTEIDLPELVEAAVTQHLDRALAKRIDLGADAHPVRVRGIEWLLRELIGNLLDNALNYTQAGGVVTLRCGPLEGGAFLEVEDDGPGIPAAERPRVLERFHRAAGAPGTGSGLGLAIVSDIVALHGARFELHGGQGGRGTRARVEFAAARRA